MFGIDDAIAAGATLITKIIDKIAPDADIEVKGKIEEALKVMQNEYNVMLAQISVNTEEAKSASVFVAGWRPAIGWVGALGIAYEIVFKPIVNGMLVLAGMPSVFTGIDIGLLQSLIGGMLGLGLARSYDKMKGTDTKTLGS